MMTHASSRGSAQEFPDESLDALIVGGEAVLVDQFCQMAFALRPAASFVSIESCHGSQVLADGLLTNGVNPAPKSEVTSMAAFESDVGLAARSGHFIGRSCLRQRIVAPAARLRGPDSDTLQITGCSLAPHTGPAVYLPERPARPPQR
jgi:hypothetical protein